MQLPEPACFTRGCIHLIGPTGDYGSTVIVCKAFPVEGIPQDILDGKDLHLEPVDGDHGIQFEADPAARFVWSADEMEELLSTAE